MKLIVGLGNPGQEYINTRHNAGFLVADSLRRMAPGVQVHKSNSFMNDSGVFVGGLVSKLHLTSLEDLYVIHDDLDIPLGDYKIQFAKGPKDHNGITSVEDALGSKNFWRVRVGVDNRETTGAVEGKEYVLQDFTLEERKIVDGVIKKICNELKHLLR